MRRVAWLIVPIIAVSLLGLVVFAARGPGPTTAFTLKAGDCFDIPSDTQVGDIATIDCSTPHDAEVFMAGAVLTPSPSDAAAGPPAYPGDAGIGQWVAANCGGNTQALYLGAHTQALPNIVVGYFFPDANAWTRGERQVTCYLHTPDGSKLNERLGGATSSAAPS